MSRGFARLAFVFVTFAVSFTAHALPFRAYLASYGKDSNPCTVDQPCRLLPAALAAVADGGEIWILDSANFNGGTVDINKSVSIVALPGQLASIVAAGGAPAITISTPNVSVGMRNLAFSRNAANPGTYGIEMTDGAALTIEDSTFAGFDHYALFPHDMGSATVTVKNTAFRGITDYAIYPRSVPSVTVLKSQFVNTKGVAYFEGPGTTFILTDSTVTNCDTGIGFTPTPVGDIHVLITHTRIEKCNVGINGVNSADPTMEVYLGDSFIAGNGTGVVASGIQIYSAGNNQIGRNTTDVMGSLIPAPLR